MSKTTLHPQLMLLLVHQGGSQHLDLSEFSEAQRELISAWLAMRYRFVARSA
jgi:hypothetical protein